VQTLTAPDAATLREQFLLDPDVVFLNHGSYGACPRPVFEEYQRWQLEMERQPVEFLGRRSEDLLDAARERLATYLHADCNDLVFVTNATSGLNIVARSLPLADGDEVLATDHEYGALDRTWEHVCAKAGAHYLHQPVPLPVSTPEATAEAIWAGVTPRTKILFLSHITSPTALRFPVEELCRRAREAGILSVVDGAHAPGQIPVDLVAIGADIYSGNCHKWLCAPKGSAFLHVRPEHHATIESTIVSWGWVEGNERWREGRLFVSRNQFQGTRDLAPYLTVSAAIDYQAANHWDEVRARCHALAEEARVRLAELTGLEPIVPAPGPDDAPAHWFAQMIAAPLPPVDGRELKRRLYDDYRIEVPITNWPGRQLIRVSFQGYNSEDDLDRLNDALRELLEKRPIT